MATADLKAAPVRAEIQAPAMSAADIAAHAAASLVRVPADTATRLQAATARYVALAACGDYEGCEYVRDQIVDLRQLDMASGTDLIRVA